MLRALYDFAATYAKSLSFKQGDYFILYQTNLKHKNWWQVINKRGEVGFVPSNYIEPQTVSEAFYLNFLDNCLDYAEHNDICAEYLITDKRDLVFRLNDLKSNVISVQYNDRDARRKEFDEADNVEFVQKCKISSAEIELLEEPIKPIKKMGNCQDSIRKSFESFEEDNNAGGNLKPEASSNPVITHQSVYELVEAVRINTHLSHELSRVAVTTVIQGLHELLPAAVFPYLSTILSHADKSLAAANVHIDATYDASRLKTIFQDLTARKEDSQQRSWMLHEDENILQDNLKELISILVRGAGF